MQRMLYKEYTLFTVIMYSDKDMPSAEKKGFVDFSPLIIHLKQSKIIATLQETGKILRSSEAEEK